MLMVEQKYGKKSLKVEPLPTIGGLKLILLAILIDFSLTVKAATLIFIFGRGSAISTAKEGKSGSIYNLVKN